MAGSILGTRVTRIEDPKLLRGQATYVDNLDHLGAAHCLFVRSTMARANINSINIDDALDMPGVHAILLAKDLDVGAFTPFVRLNSKLTRKVLASSRVNFVGDPIALIVADSRAKAEDAAELIEIEYEELEAVIDPERAFDPDVPQIDQDVPANLAASASAGNSDDPLGDAEVVVRARIVNQRMAVVPMEPSSIAVHPSAGSGPITIYVSTQMPHFLHSKVAEILSISKDSLHVISPDVGGGFGGKAGLTPEYLAVIAASIKLGLPLRWIETREENILAMQGRAQTQFVELGLKRDGTITGLRCRMIGDAGAYGGFGGGLVIGSTKAMAQGVYRIPKVSFLAAVSSTNTSPIGALRGAGRPEATAFLERIVDMAAAELEIDPIELRLKNMIGKDEFPYQTLMGPTYDSGDYALALERALELANYAELRKEQKRRRDNHDLVALGIGISCYVEVTGGSGSEFGAVDISNDGGATIRVGTSGHGQGHQTTFSMLVCDTLKIPLEKITFIQSDTVEVPRGGGTGGSRSLQLGGSAVGEAAKKVLEIAKSIAATAFEASPEDIILDDSGTLSVVGSPSFSMTWPEVHQAGIEQGVELAYRGDFEQKSATFPFGAHVSIVEVDTETGKVTSIGHIAVDDCGRVLNPLVVEGQQHGGIAQGIAQAILEEFSYDAYGNPRNSSLAEYLVPSAAELPSFVVANTQTPSPHNPIGAKGIGESATVGSTPAVQNAIVDALSHLGVRHVDMPATPQRIWQAINLGKNVELWSEPPEIFEQISASKLRGEFVEEIEI